MNYNKREEKKTMTVKEFSIEYGVGLNKAYELTNSEGFPAIRCGRRFIIIKSKLDDWIEDNIGKAF